MGRWEVLEEIALADCALEIQGKNLADLFETAACALAHLMVEPTTLDGCAERRLTLTASRLDILLFDWLGELILLKDRDGEIFPTVEVTIEGTGPFTLHARLEGGAIGGHTALRSDPKAVTLHHFELRQAADGWRARVIIDI
jgi:SHS2 domain-containing protein